MTVTGHCIQFTARLVTNYCTSSEGKAQYDKNNKRTIKYKFSKHFTSNVRSGNHLNRV